MMRAESEIREDYFGWLCDFVCAGRFANEISYRKLLIFMHSTKFIYVFRSDKNRSEDGKSLRLRYTRNEEVPLCLKGPCTVLEMMVALAVRCEDDITYDPTIGDRTGQWFWSMVTSLGLGGMMDDRFDRGTVNAIIDRFLYREYEPNGSGGLFTVQEPREDMRRLDIWTQLNRYLENYV